MQSQTLRVHCRKCTVTKVELVINPTLERAFEAKRCAFEAAGLPAEEILAYHGSSDQSYEKIIEQNFDISKLAANTGKTMLSMICYSFWFDYRYSCMCDPTRHEFFL